VILQMNSLLRVPLLEVSQVTKSFGGVTAVRNIDLTVCRGEIVSLIGPNGAGKTTLFDMITGFLRPTAGSIWFDGRVITGWSPQKVARLGIIRTFQITNVFYRLTVEQNLEAAQYLKISGPFWHTLVAHRTARTKRRQAREYAEQLIELVGLAGLAREEACTLAYGKLRLLEIAIGLAASPRLLLLDEPAAGLNTEESVRLVELLRRVCQEHGITLLLVEHDMDVVMSISDRVVVMNFGEKIAEGGTEEVRRDPRVVEAYLGAHLHDLDETTHA
jgi:branched-chain amino acid transport system ATP-binding protein